MIPSSSPYYTYEVVIADAHCPRERGTVAVAPELPLKVTYRKYRATKATSSGPLVNLVFLHGTGMNKGIWHYHIDKLYQQQDRFQLNTVLAVDVVNHGESGYANRGRLTDTFDSRDSAKDVLKLVSQDEKDEFTKPQAMNIIIGHSFGGFIATYACFLEPKWFDSCIALNPVVHVFASIDSTRKFNSWKRRGFMKDDFVVEGPARWYADIEQFFATKSFLLDFDKRILPNVLEDEISPEIRENAANFQKGSYINLNTSVDAQMNVYLHMDKVVPFGMAAFPGIVTPVYLLVAEHDFPVPEARETTKILLKNVVHPIDIPNAKHLVNGEDPDTTTDLFLLVIQTRTLLKRKEVHL